MFIETPVKGTIKPLASGTRLREDANTKASYTLPTYGINDVVEVDLVREYTASDANLAITKGDKWGRVVKINGVEKKGWMAIYYQIVTPPNICTPNYTVKDDAPVPPSGEKPKIIGATVIARFSDGSVSEPVNMKVV